MEQRKGIEVLTKSSDKTQREFPYDYYEQSFSVSYDYPVYFTRGLFSLRNDLLASVIDRFKEGRRHRVKVFVDDGVLKSTPGLTGRVRSYFENHSAVLKMEGSIGIVPGGERGKMGFGLVKDLMAELAQRRLCRQSFVIAVGGGSVLDIVGLAASLVHRGLRLIRVPTTVLSQDDAGVGVKNGIDEWDMKNFAGTFAPPFAILIDYDFLRTLDSKYWIGGIAEAYKVAIIKDRPFFDFLFSHAEKLRNRDEAAIEAVVKRCAILHLEHIRTSGDPFEFGMARPLDFGHWSAHRLELISQYELGHGQAVSIGIALDSIYAAQIGLLTVQARDGILDALEKTGLPIWSDFLERKNKKGELEVIKGLRDFQEHLGGELHITLPNGIGGKVEIHKMDPRLIQEAITYLKKRVAWGSKVLAFG